MESIHTRRDAERRAVESVSSILQSLVFAETLAASEIAYIDFATDLARSEPAAISTIEALSSDIDKLKAMLRVLSTLRAKFELFAAQNDPEGAPLRTPC